MKFRSIGAAAVVALVVAACGPQQSPLDADGAWVGTISTEGDVTTVVNEAGSVWGGTARLVEEASIGVESGDEPYLFGQITSVTAAADRIVVADAQVPAVRVYDFLGNYLHDLGRAGDGPGEYRAPYSVRTDDRDRVFIRDDRRYLVHLYSLEGAHIETWDTHHLVRTFSQMTVTGDGRLVTSVVGPAEEGAERRSGMQMFAAEGAIGPLIAPPTFDFEPVRILAESGSSMGVRFPSQYPNVHSTLDPSERVIAGVATEYRFEIRLPDGATIVVEKYWDPVPVPEQERSDVRDRLTTWARGIDPEWRWEIPPIPETKPPFSGLVAAKSGEVWVLRSMESRRMADCVEDVLGFEECWEEDTAYDVFESSGRFLGTVPAPQGLVPFLVPHVDGDVFVGVIEDAEGVQYIKRYRLVLPGEEGS